LDHNDKLALFTHVTKHRGGKGATKPLPNIITDPKQLDEFQHLDEMIEKLVSHLNTMTLQISSTLYFLMNTSAMSWCSNEKPVSQSSHPNVGIRQVVWICNNVREGFNCIFTSLMFGHVGE
jgi:hypothetical protein